MSQVINPAVALTADRYFYPHDCRGLGTKRVVSWQFSGVQTGTPVGVIKFEGSDDPRVENDLLVLDGVAAKYGTSGETAKWVPLTLPSTAVVHGSGFTAPTLPQTPSAVAWDGTAALIMAIIFECPMARMRAWWDHTSGGTTSSLLTVWSADEAL